MARIQGVDIPKNKHVIIAITYVYGIGPTLAKTVIERTKLSPTTRVKDLSEDELVKLRGAIAEHIVEGDLRRQIQQNIRRLTEITSYRGIRHRKKLPCRGQRTHTNARTKRGRRIAVAGKKKVTK